MGDKLETGSFFQYHVEFPVPSDVCSYTVLEAIYLLPTPEQPMTYYLKCSLEDVFWAYLAITPIEGADIKVEPYLGYECCEWSLELRYRPRLAGLDYYGNGRIIVHSDGC